MVSFTHHSRHSVLFGNLGCKWQKVNLNLFNGNGECIIRILGRFSESKHRNEAPGTTRISVPEFLGPSSPTDISFHPSPSTGRFPLLLHYLLGYYILQSRHNKRHHVASLSQFWFQSSWKRSFLGLACLRAKTEHLQPENLAELSHIVTLTDQSDGARRVRSHCTDMTTL